MKRNDLIGECFGRLIVLGVHSLCRKQNVLWECACICGGLTKAYAHDLRAGKVKSCGCLSKEGMHTTHGKARAGNKRSREYSVWATMLQRCANPTNKNYFNYGGRGITVCRRWLAFENFYADMGACEKGLTLERKNNSRGYSKSNCEWTTRAAQGRNRRANVYVVVQGRRMLLTDAYTLLGMSKTIIYHIMKRDRCLHQKAIDTWQQQQKA